MADKLSKLLRQRIIANNTAKESADLLNDKATSDIKWDVPKTNESGSVLIEADELNPLEQDIARMRTLRFSTNITSSIDSTGRITLGADDLSDNLRILRDTLNRHKNELKAAGNSNELKLIRANITKLQRTIINGRKKTERILINAATGPGLNEIVDNIGGVSSRFEDIKNNILNILRGGKTQPKPPTKTAISTEVIGSISFGAASTLVSLEKSIKHVKQSAQNGRLRDKTGKFFSLVTLTNLLNGRLEDAIKRNMGTGSAKNVLNYRSGRFAKTVNINRITLGRTGYATIFYDWMKYPYETFSPGFAQGSISTRDPKLLISKSIREIASDLISNKFKSVST